MKYILQSFSIHIVYAFLMIIVLASVVDAAMLTDSTHITSNIRNIDKYNNAVYDSTAIGIYLGTTGSGPHKAGFIFTGRQVTKNATIDSAYLMFRAHGDANESTTVVNLVIYGEDTASATNFGDTIDFNSRIRTTAKVYWSGVPVWNVNGAAWLYSIDLSTIIAEITSRTDWAVGNSIGIYVKDSGSTGDSHRRVRSYNWPNNPSSNDSTSVRLVIKYESAGSPNTKIGIRGGHILGGHYAKN